mgnify:CR=1 FL=1
MNSDVADKTTIVLPALIRMARLVTRLTYTGLALSDLGTRLGLKQRAEEHPELGQLIRSPGVVYNKYESHTLLVPKLLRGLEVSQDESGERTFSALSDLLSDEGKLSRTIPEVQGAVDL